MYELLKLLLGSLFDFIASSAGSMLFALALLSSLAGASFASFGESPLAAFDPLLTRIALGLLLGAASVSLAMVFFAVILFRGLWRFLRPVEEPSIVVTTEP
ncbi:MAG: hypothetical protein U1F36_01280 [Planctomycetota bacterium]